MKISFHSNVDNYVNFLVTRSKQLPQGKERRKRFYVGFSMLYFILSMVITIIMIYQRILIDPYVIMFSIIYVVAMAYMLLIDAYSMVISKRFRRDASKLDIEIKYTLERDKGTFVLKFNNKQERYNISDQTMYYIGEEFVTLFFDQDTGISIPVAKYTDEFQDLKRL